MAKPITVTLAPDAESAFLKAVRAFATNLLKTASGEDLQVVGHYQEQWQQRIEECDKLTARPKRRTHARG